jgi:hypothetical protein
VRENFACWFYAQQKSSEGAVESWRKENFQVNYFFSPFLLLKVSLLFSISKRRMDEEKAILLSQIKKKKQKIACDGNFLP